MGKQQNKKFPTGIKTAIAMMGIRDKHIGKKPEYIMCNSVRQLAKKLRDYLPAGRIMPYNRLLELVKENGVVDLLKENYNNKITYRL